MQMTEDLSLGDRQAGKEAVWGKLSLNLIALVRHRLQIPLMQYYRPLKKFSSPEQRVDRGSKECPYSRLNRGKQQLMYAFIITFCIYLSGFIYVLFTIYYLFIYLRDSDYK